MAFLAFERVPRSWLEQVLLSQGYVREFGHRFVFIECISLPGNVYLIGNECFRSMLDLLRRGAADWLRRSLKWWGLGSNRSARLETASTSPKIPHLVARHSMHATTNFETELAAMLLAETLKSIVHR